MSLVILNFHGVGDIPRPLSDGERHCWLENRFFESVLDAVADRPNVRLTFDDGNVTDFTTVLPALLKRNLRASFFVCSGRLDQPFFLTREQVRILSENGMTIGSHGINHVSWRKLPAAELSQELVASRAVLQDACGAPVDTAACPFGDYNRNVLKLLHHSGYRSVFTSDGGVAAESGWLVARNTVTRSSALSNIEELVQRGPARWEQYTTRLRTLVKRLRWR